MRGNIIRRLFREDIPLIINFLKDERFNCCELSDFWTAEELKEWLSKKSDICLGYFTDNELVGFCLSHFSKSINKVYLENIFVNTYYRRQGIASLIVSKLLEMYCMANKGKKLRFVALVETDNTPSISMLKKEGFNIGEKMLWIQKNSTFKV